MRRDVVPWLIFAFLVLVVAADGQDLVVKAARLHTVSGEVIPNGLIVIRDGKIAAIGPAAGTPIPEGLQILEAPVVTPGLIDAHSVAGLAGWLNQPHDSDEHEAAPAIQPELRALDAINVHEPLIAWLRGHGVTTIHTGFDTRGLISGTSVIVKTREAPLKEVVLNPRAMVLASLSDGARATGGKSPGTKAKMAAMIRQVLIEAGEYAAKRSAEDESKRPQRDLRLEALADVLSRKRPLLITAERDRDLRTALRLQEEFGFRLVLDGGAEIYRALDVVHAAKVPVIIHPTMARSRGERENLSLETAGKLGGKDILFAFQSGYESYVPKTRVVLFEAAIAAANGLPFEGALRALTLDAARILGVEKRVGSLEIGKDADLVLYDGAPFEYTTHVVGVVIDGRVVSQTAR